MKTASRLSKWFFYLLILPIVLGVSAWQGWAWWSWASAPSTPNPAEGAVNGGTAIPAVQAQAIQIRIAEGTTAQQIGEDLQAAGLIRSLDAWNLWTKLQSLQNRAGNFQAGTYEISPSESLPDIANKLWDGKVVERSFTIPEGWSIQQMATYFAGQGYFSADDFIAATQVIPRDRFPWLPENLTNLEGFLYPDTYSLAGQLTPQGAIDQMLDQFGQVALPLYQQAQGQTPYTLVQWVTLSSLVEKEAAVSQERPQIASVFAKRLRQEIPLASDPTVEYGLGIRQTKEQPLTLAQVNTPSPYNTYLNPGLPPTPIASPGRASLIVSLNPPDTEYLYFVARYDGTHVFSKTLAEHEAAQGKIRDGVEAQSETQRSPVTPVPSLSPAAPEAQPTTGAPN
ncbi:MAG: endolytic transglycosylase MltG [Leptolyngbyaceae cyanobacterium CRU_2_3]|nr:endolytic transglycosylase MltG [Leptolyngbyaceae cyanobacterium CRU_2_3]